MNLKKYVHFDDRIFILRVISSFISPLRTQMWFLEFFLIFGLSLIEANFKDVNSDIFSFTRELIFALKTLYLRAPNLKKLAHN